MNYEKYKIVEDIWNYIPTSGTTITTNLSGTATINLSEPEGSKSKFKVGDKVRVLESNVTKEILGMRNASFEEEFVVESIAVGYLHNRGGFNFEYNCVIPERPETVAFFYEDELEIYVDKQLAIVQDNEYKDLFE